MEPKYFAVSATKVAQLLGTPTHGTKIAKEEQILGIVGRAGDHKKWSRDVSDDYEWRLNQTQAQELAEFFDQSRTWRTFIRGLHPNKRFRTGTLFRPDRDRAEIYWEELSDINLLEETPDPVSKRIAAYVDEVEFRQKDPNGDISLRAGHYIRIEPTAPFSDGAITLIVDGYEQRVLLISQYRHNTGGYMVEACRGFGDPDDRNEEHTGERERQEETFFDSSSVLKKETLGYVHTDSGKLKEQPGYFLEFVDANSKMAEFNLKKPALEDPVWISLKQFYRAIISQRPVRLSRSEPKEYDFILKKNWRDDMNSRAEINNGSLIINDSFTIVAAFLALPYILAHYGISAQELLE